MPADSEPGPTLPHTWRPLGVRMIGYVSGFALVAVSVGAWIAIGPEIRSRFTPFELITMVALAGLAAAVWYSLLRARLSASTEGVVVVNGFKRRDLEWAQVVALRLRRGAPWADMDLADGTTIPVMAIQGSDGSRAVSAVREFRAVLQIQSRTDRDD